MRALNAIHAALRPSGVLLDIHPEPEHARIEVHLEDGDRIVRLGAIDQSIQIERITVTRAALQRTITAGLWRLEREVSFEVLYHFEGVDAWLQYLAERQSESIIPEGLVARARELLATSPGELIQRRAIHAARLRRT